MANGRAGGRRAAQPALGTCRRGRKNASYKKRPPTWGPTLIIQRLLTGEPLEPWLRDIAKRHRTTLAALRQEIHRWLASDELFKADYDAAMSRQKPIRDGGRPNEWPANWRALFRAAYVASHGSVVKACRMIGLPQAEVFCMLRAGHPAFDAELAAERALADEEIASRAQEIFVSSVEQAFEQGDYKTASFAAGRLLESLDPRWSRKQDVAVTARLSPSDPLALEEASARLAQVIIGRVRKAVEAGVTAELASPNLPSLEAPRRPEPVTIDVEFAHAGPGDPAE
jgi:hypothetical protein